MAANQRMLNECGFRATSSGTGDFVVSAALSGLFTPASCAHPVIVNGGTYTWRAVSDDKLEHELFTGAYNSTAGGTISRTTILQSSNSNAKVNFTAAPQVRMVASQQDMLYPCPSNHNLYIAKLLGQMNQGTGYTGGVYSNVPVLGGTGSGAAGDFFISTGGNIVSWRILSTGNNSYVAGDVLSVSNASVGGTGSNFSFTIVGVGDDNNEGTTSDRPFATINRGLTEMNRMDFSNGNILTMNVSPGLYPERLQIKEQKGGRRNGASTQILGPTTADSVVGRQEVWVRPTTNAGPVLFVENANILLQHIWIDASHPSAGGWEAVRQSGGWIDAAQMRFSMAANDNWWLIELFDHAIFVHNGITVEQAGTQYAMLYMNFGSQFSHSFDVTKVGSAATYTRAMVVMQRGCQYGTEDVPPAPPSYWSGFSSDTGTTFELSGGSIFSHFAGTALPYSTALKIDGSCKFINFDEQNGIERYSYSGFASVANVPTSTTELPFDRTWGVFKEHTGNKVYIACNDGGTIKKVELV